MAGRRLLLALLAAAAVLLTGNLQEVGADQSEFPGLEEAPTESQCRPYIEKALKQHGTGESAPSGEEAESPVLQPSAASDEQPPIHESATGEVSKEQGLSAEIESAEEAGGEITSAEVTEQVAESTENAPASREKREASVEQTPEEKGAESAEDVASTEQNDVSLQGRDGEEPQSAEEEAETEHIFSVEDPISAEDRAAASYTFSIEEPVSGSAEEPKEASTEEEPEATSKEELEVVSKEEAEAASTEEPEAASKEESEAASAEEPEAASAEEPEAASAEEPEAASAEEPEAASAEEPEAASVEEPEAASAEEPEPASPEEPEAGSTEEPEAGSAEEDTTASGEAAFSVEEPVSVEEHGTVDESAFSVEEPISAEELTVASAEETETTSGEGGFSVEEPISAAESAEAPTSAEEPEAESVEAPTSAEEPAAESVEAPPSAEEPAAESVEAPISAEEPAAESAEAPTSAEEPVSESVEVPTSAEEPAAESAEVPTSAEEPAAESAEEPTDKSAEVPTSAEEHADKSAEVPISAEETAAPESAEESPAEEISTSKEEAPVSAETEGEDKVASEAVPVSGEQPASTEEIAQAEEPSEETSAEEAPAAPVEGEPETTPEEELTLGLIIPDNLRPREHITQILRLDSDSAEQELLTGKTVETTLKELKKLYDSAIKPLEILYKYRDLSNRHFGDPEIFSKPLILFMGPWSGGKSSIINYLLDNEYKHTSLRTGAEPSPAYFNILMWGEREEILDGTQLAADWTFSGLQKFGQGLLDRLRGLRLTNRLLEKVNIVEIPGILEIRKQVERLFPFNDACQWFIDRADIIFLVYDPSKLDVGPETEAILDQLKGREYQTRIILNKADQVRPEELMRVQGTLIWNISPLMSSSEPPVMYSTSLWSLPYESGAPIRLLQAQERAFLRDMRDAVEKRVENKIASARRFAVRVRNHAKMVDCYLTTYYNHKSFFGNRKKVSDDIIERPQDYHIYEGLSTLTNISRYDLPDPDVYRDFFRLNPLYEFQLLSSTCTYFRGCPINRLDIAIAYDLPELVGKYKKSVDEALKSQNPSKS